MNKIKKTLTGRSVRGCARLTPADAPHNSLFHTNRSMLTLPIVDVFVVVVALGWMCAYIVYKSADLRSIMRSALISLLIIACLLYTIEPVIRAVREKGPGQPLGLILSTNLPK